MDTRAERDAASDCVALRIRKFGSLESAISVIHSGTSRAWTLPPLHASPRWCVTIQAERDALSDRLSLRSRKNAPMFSNRDVFRHFASTDRLRVTIRSVLGEARYNLRVLVVEMRRHSRCRQMATPVPRRAIFRDRARCATRPLKYRCP